MGLQQWQTHPEEILLLQAKMWIVLYLWYLLYLL